MISTVSPEIIQFAKDGKYEDAWIISLNQSRPVLEKVNEYINLDKYEKLIVEYIWNNDDDQSRYILTVIQDKGCLVQDRQKFISLCLNAFYNKLTFDKLIGYLEKEIVGKKCLLNSPVQKVRLGIFNHWFSVGPIELWDKGDKYDPDKVEQEIKARPEVEKSNLNYQGLAFIYNFDGTENGPYHILKTPCCYKQADQWIADIPLINENMKLLLNEGK